MEENKVNLTRRKFLIATRCAGVIGAAALLAGRSATVEAATVTAAPDEPPDGKRGYRETEHIRKYYYCAGYW